MKKNRKWIFRIAALAIVLAVAVAMFIIGRGHTVYFDNKGTAADGSTVETPYKIEVIVGGEKVAKLYEGERGVAETMGQSIEATISVTQEKGGDEKHYNITLPIPYNMDGIIVNVPALLSGAPRDVYMEEFVPAPETVIEEDEEVVTDEFVLPEDEE